MPYHIAICDDDADQLEEIVSMVSRWSRVSDHSSEIQTFPSAEAFLFAYEEDKTFDLLLLDVEMKGISGIELARCIRKENSRAEIIFITSHFEFVTEGYEVDALHYLVKPVSEEKLGEVLDKAAARLKVEPPSVVITCEGETVRLYETEILYVEAFLHYISIHTKERDYRIKESISSFEKNLSADFYRIHRSYLVSLKYVRRISRTSIMIEGGMELPLARGKYDDVNRAFIAQN